MVRYKYTEAQQIYEVLLHNVTNHLRHEHYDHTIAVADFWHKMITGKNHDDYIVTYRPNETDGQKKQRLRVYKSRTKYLINRIRTQIKKSDRVDYAIDQIYYEGSEDSSSNEKVKALKSRFEEFYGDQSLKEYVNENFRELNEIDANAAIIVNHFDFKPPEKATTYPVIVRAEGVLNYERYNGRLQYLICNIPVTVQVRKWTNDKKKDSTLEEVLTDKVFIFAPNYNYSLEEILEDQVIDPEDDRDRVLIDRNGKVTEYFREEYENFSDRLQGCLAGYIKDPCTNGETFESIYFPGKEILEDIINKKSEVDTNLLTHGIIQKFAYKPKCKNANKQKNTVCHNGKLDGKECKVCKGSGFQPYHTSSQDIITLNLQLNDHVSPDQIIDMSKLIHYAEIPKHVLDLYMEVSKQLETDFSTALFNVDVFTQQFNGTKTAEEIRARNEALNNVLFEYCVAKSEKYAFIVKQTAIFMDQIEGLVCNFRPATDFKLDSLDDLLLQYTKADGAPRDVKESILQKIYHKQNQDNPDRVAMISARERWRPFRHMTESERSVTIDLLPSEHPEKILWIHFDRIFSEIEHTKEFSIGQDGRIKIKTPFHRIKAYDIQEEIVEFFINKYREKFLQFRQSPLTAADAFVDEEE